MSDQHIRLRVDFHLLDHGPFDRQQPLPYAVRRHAVFLFADIEPRELEILSRGRRVPCNRAGQAPTHAAEEPEKSEKVYPQRDFTIKELSENFTAKQAGADLPHRVVGTVTVEDNRGNRNTDH
ncbi:hypothetical protein ACIQCF_37515 [Streptomyces sp. NPDC088353]|uniref:hypothetical protein n=1 Tax=Streptomyces sp. NPDC088353 TaxID=3365855 RepID=UPI003802457E